MRLLACVVVAAASPSASLAAWLTQTGDLFVSAKASSGAYELRLYCEREMGLVMELQGPPVEGAPADHGAKTGLIMTIGMRDGRSFHQPVDVVLHSEAEIDVPLDLTAGPVWSGEILVGSFFRTFFSGASGMQLGFPLADAAAIEFDMTGSAKTMAAIDRVCRV